MFRRRQTTPSEPPEWLVVGLGNPGPEYKGTRHNVGFEIVDALGKTARIDVKTGKMKALVGVGKLGDTTVMLVKPLTYMNLSGQSVSQLTKSTGIPPERVLVIADDLDLPVGALRLRADGGSGGHNGHKSLIKSLGTEGYPRLKVGIGSNKDDTVDHVLSRFTPTEREYINDAIEASWEIVRAVVNGSWTEALDLVARYKHGG